MAIIQAIKRNNWISFLPMFEKRFRLNNRWKKFKTVFGFCITDEIVLFHTFTFYLCFYFPVRFNTLAEYEESQLIEIDHPLSFLVGSLLCQTSFFLFGNKHTHTQQWKIIAAFMRLAKNGDNRSCWVFTIKWLFDRGIA